MTNKITSSISNVIKDSRGHEFKTRIDNLPGNNWTKEIKELATEFSLDAEHIIADIKHFLTDTLTPEHIEHELKANAKEYKKFYELMKNESFKEAEEIVESLSAYIEKLKTNTQKRLTHVLLANPGAAHRMPVFMKNVLGEELPVVKEDTKESNSIHEESQVSLEQPEERLLSEITTILHKEIWDEDKIKEIKDIYKKIYSKNMVNKVLLRNLGLEEEYVRSFKELNIPVLALLVLIKRNPADEQAKSDLGNLLTGNKLNPEAPFKTPGEKEVKPIKIKEVWFVDLSKFPQGKKDKKIEIVKEEPEIMQKPTMNPLELVGKTMTHQEFISACGLSYEEIRKHEMKGESMPARYASYNKIPLKDKSMAHFFTIWEEIKGIHSIPINVFISQDSTKTFNEGEIYKIKVIGMLDSRKSGSTRQSKSVQWELVVDEVESVWSGNFLWWAKWASKLLQTFVGK